MQRTPVPRCSVWSRCQLDNQNRFLWRLPSNPTSPESLKSNLRLPSYEDQTTSIIMKSRNLYISRVTSIRPYVSRVTESNNAPHELLQSNITSPEWRNQTLRLPSFFNQTLHLPSNRIKPCTSWVSSIRQYINHRIIIWLTHRSWITR